MTREKVVYELENSIKLGISISHEAREWLLDYLEQEPIIDKIRAEIEHLTIAEGGDDYVRKMAELFSFKVKVLQIIDKYKAESEADNGNDD